MGATDRHTNHVGLRQKEMVRRIRPVAASQCERQSEIKGSMPFASLNRFQADRPLVSIAAWQPWIGLPEGASVGLRLKHLLPLSDPFRHFEAANTSSIDATASPCAGRLDGFMQRRAHCVRMQSGCGQLEDGVPHAEALSPANFSSVRRSANLGTRTRKIVALA